VLAHGFAWVLYESYKDELLVAFSCKGRGVCPSCDAKRALVDGGAPGGTGAAVPPRVARSMR